MEQPPPPLMRKDALVLEDVTAASLSERQHSSPTLMDALSGSDAASRIAMALAKRTGAPSDLGICSGGRKGPAASAVGPTGSTPRGSITLSERERAAKALKMRSVSEAGAKMLEPNDVSILSALALLQRFQSAVASSATASVTVYKEELDQLMDGFAEALEQTPTPKARVMERQMQRLFVSHANVFDERVQDFILQNFIQEPECVKTLRTAMRRTSLVRRCLRAMQPSPKRDSIDKPTWRQSLMQRAAASRARAGGLEACPDVKDLEIVQFVKRTLLNLSSWDFDIFGLSRAVPGQTLLVVGNELLDQYEMTTHFNSSKSRQREFLKKIQHKYHPHPYHNGEHAADVVQTMHHFLSVGGIGVHFSPRVKCAALLAAIVHDVGHTSFNNNFHIARNDDLAMQYLYRSPLEHMHCALAFQVMKTNGCNILHGLTRVEQLEIRNQIADMVLATDNSAHSASLAKLEGLACRSSGDDASMFNDPDNVRLVLQMTLHAADVSNPAKPINICCVWAERILREFHQQGDQEKELQLPVSVGYDRDFPIPLEKMQAGFILGIVRPLFTAVSRLPQAHFSHVLTQLDDNLRHWQQEITLKTEHVQA